MKSNDNIPEDEMLLAEMIAEAKARGFGWCSGGNYRSKYNDYDHTIMETTVDCCAVGALKLLDPGRTVIHMQDTYNMARGNDSDGDWVMPNSSRDIGRAYREFWTVE